MLHKEKVLEALRSGEFEQLAGELGLVGTSQRCCLGVMCEVAIRNGLDIHVNRGGPSSSIAYDDERFELPASVTAFFDLDDHDPDIPGDAQLSDGRSLSTFMAKTNNLADKYTLSSLNDNGLSFEEIALLIERYL